MYICEYVYMYIYICVNAPLFHTVTTLSHRGGESSVPARVGKGEPGRGLSRYSSADDTPP